MSRCPRCRPGACIHSNHRHRSTAVRRPVIRQHHRRPMTAHHTGQAAGMDHHRSTAVHRAVIRQHHRLRMTAVHPAAIRQHHRLRMLASHTSRAACTRSIRRVAKVETRCIPTSLQVKDGIGCLTNPATQSTASPC